jgi:hypothetical protein
MAATVLRIAADRIVSDSEVELGEVLGYGAYGVASRGRIRGEDVCIKVRMGLTGCPSRIGHTPHIFPLVLPTNSNIT